MNSKRIILLFALALLLTGPRGYAEDPDSNPSSTALAVSPVDPAGGTTPITAQSSGQWSDGWYRGASGYDKAVEAYKQTNKPMLVYMSVGWCPYCRQFEKGVLSSPAVRDFLKDKIKVFIDPESGKRENELAFQYGLRGFPSLFLHPPQPGQPLQCPTRVTPEEFISLFQQSIQ